MMMKQITCWCKVDYGHMLFAVRLIMRTFSWCKVYYGHMHVVVRLIIIMITCALVLGRFHGQIIRCICCSQAYDGHISVSKAICGQMHVDVKIIMVTCI